MNMKKVREYPVSAISNNLVHVFEMGNGGPSAELHVAVEPDFTAAREGAGGVHHVAFRTPDYEGLKAWTDRVRDFRVPSSGEVERYYFRSLYFREPGGVLFEIATDIPGFTADEPLETLGEHLSLPPFLEGRRASIEANLQPLEPASGACQAPNFARNRIMIDDPYPDPRDAAPWRTACLAGRRVAGQGPRRGDHAAWPRRHAPTISCPCRSISAATTSPIWRRRLPAMPGIRSASWSRRARQRSPISARPSERRREPCRRSDAAGIPDERIVLLGFSQGACLALESAVRRPHRYGGVVGLSGGLIGADDRALGRRRADIAGTPVILGCAELDGHIPLARVEATAERFETERRGGHQADLSRLRPYGVNEDEVGLVRKLLSDLGKTAASA